MFSVNKNLNLPSGAIYLKKHPDLYDKYGLYRMFLFHR